MTKIKIRFIQPESIACSFIIFSFCVSTLILSIFCNSMCFDKAIICPVPFGILSKCARVAMFEREEKLEKLYNLHLSNQIYTAQIW